MVFRGLGQWIVMALAFVVAVSIMALVYVYLFRDCLKVGHAFFYCLLET